MESAYTACLVYELHKLGLEVDTEVPVPLVYEGIKLTDVGYRIDILVAKELVVEIKSIEVVAPVHLSQLISYLKLSDRRLGLLINFNVDRLKSGIYRRVNQFKALTQRSQRVRQGSQRIPSRSFALSWRPLRQGFV